MMRLSIIDNLFVIVNTRICYIFYMLPINFDYNPDFLKAEKRDGENVSEDMKKLWLVELDILNKFIQVCNKYGLIYWAEGGTLLGAARHKGYIPWDNDIDILMLRDDYEKFLKVAEEEFKYPYYVEKKGTPTFDVCTRIKRLDTTLMGNKKKETFSRAKLLTTHLMCAGIDIFCADNCPNTNTEREKLHIDLVFLYKRYNAERSKFIHSYRFKNNQENLYKAFDALDNVCKRYNNTDTDYIFNSAFPTSPIEPDHMRYKEDYAEEVFLPFEMFELRCPKGYERVLDMHYTQRTGVPWQKPTKGLGYHKEFQCLFIDVDTPFTEYVRYFFDRPENKLPNDTN